MTTALQKKRLETPQATENGMVTTRKIMPAQSVSAPIQSRLPAERISGLLNAIGRNLPVRDGASIVHFVSAYKREGADLIAFETALAAARAGKRALFIDTGTSKLPLLKQLRGKAGPSLRDGDDAASPFLNLQGASLLFAVLPETHGVDGAVPDAPGEELLNALRPQFDLIFVYSEAALTNPLALALFGLADGCIVVAEAERTRIPVIKSLHRLIDTHGGRAIGAVLNKRKFHIPRLIYSLFFGS